MSTYSDSQIGDFLGNIELHLITIKTLWPVWLDTTKDQTTRDAAKTEVIDCVNHIQMILNSIESSLGITLPSNSLDSTQMQQFGIT